MAPREIRPDGSEPIGPVSDRQGGAVAGHGLTIRVLHRGWNTFGMATITLPDGRTVERAIEDHGEAACVLPYDPQRRVAILVRQTRIAPRFWGAAGDMLEVPAGSIDDEVPDAAARREVLEEAGLRLGMLEPVVHAYTMPGVSTERLHLYLAPYAAADRIGAGGGLADEGEDIAVEEIPLAVLSASAAAGRLDDLKTLVLVQALQLRRPDLFVPDSGGHDDV